MMIPALPLEYVEVNRRDGAVWYDLYLGALRVGTYKYVSATYSCADIFLTGNERTFFYDPSSSFDLDCRQWIEVCLEKFWEAVHKKRQP